MTIIEIGETHSKVTPDAGKMLYIGLDPTPYSEIVCRNSMLSKIREERFYDCED